MPSMRRVLAILAILSVTILPAARAQNAQLTLLHINDVYEIAPQGGEGGLAELMTLLRRERAAHEHTITTVGGDFLSPSILSGLTKGAQMIELFNAIGVDLVGFGNHEFDFGTEILKQRIAASHFSWLGTNLREGDGKRLGGALATTIKQVGDVRVGFFGIVTPETATLSSGAAGVAFADPIETARAAVMELRRDGAHVVIALTHLAYDEDRALIRAVPGLDLVLGGHDHEPVTFLEKGVLLHKSGLDAHYLGAVDLDIRTRQTAKGPVTSVRPSWRMLANAGTVPDAKVAAVVKTYTDRLEAELGQPIGRTTVALDSRGETLRSGEAAIGNLVSDALREGLDADVAITNGGGIRGNVVREAGVTLTRKDILAELPFGNLALLLELSGADLRAALENGLSKVEEKAGRFPQVAGLRLEFDPKGDPGQRIRSIAIAGRPLDPAGHYRVATNDYLAAGGDGYAALTRGKVLGDARFAKLLAAIVMDYIERKGTVSPAVEGRVVARD